jgi:SAM-dependent methyltransferase
MIRMDYVSAPLPTEGLVKMSDQFDSVSDLAWQYGNIAKRLEKEIPFFTQRLNDLSCRNVCDAGCGIGHHTIALARNGFQMTGVDPSAESVAEAESRARAANVMAHFFLGRFQTVCNVKTGPFDAVLALGNSLALAPDWDALNYSLAGISLGIRPGGIFICQMPNYLLFHKPGQRWKPIADLTPEGGGDPNLLIKHFAPDGPDHFALEFVNIKRGAQVGWEYSVQQTRVLALTAPKLEKLIAPHYHTVARYGSVDGRPFDYESPDLIMVLRKTLA